MPKITHETEEEVFVFGQEKVFEFLESLDTDEAKGLVEFLESQAGDNAALPRDNRVLPYAIPKLLGQGEKIVGARHLNVSDLI